MGDSGHHNAREPVLGWESGFGLESSPALWDLKESLNVLEPPVPHLRCMMDPQSKASLR